jgi:hypothetical protein
MVEWKLPYYSTPTDPLSFELQENNTALWKIPNLSFDLI